MDIVGKEEVKGNILFNEDTTLYLIWESSNPLNPSEPIVSTKPVEEVTDNPEKVEETVNVIKDVVKTNDNNSVLLYANVCALTIVGVTIIVLMKKKEDLMNR